MRFSISLPSTRALLLVPVLVLAIPTASAGQRGASDPSFRSIGTYDLVVDGSVVEADFFHSTGHGSILVHTPELSKWIELVPRGRQVALYAPAAIHRNVDGTYDKLPSPPPEPAGTFELVDNLPKFMIGGRAITVTRRPDLLGPHTAEQIMDHDGSYRIRADGYRPANADFLSRLQSVQEPILVRVFFGSWCSVCVELLPHVFKVEELLAGSALRFEYHGIPKDFDDPEVKRLGITTTPSAIVYAGEEEIGRISGYSWRFPEVALHNTLAGAGKLR